MTRLLYERLSHILITSNTTLSTLKLVNSLTIIEILQMIIVVIMFKLADTVTQLIIINHLNVNCLCVFRYSD